MRKRTQTLLLAGCVLGMGSNVFLARALYQANKTIQRYDRALDWEIRQRELEQQIRPEGNVYYANYKNAERR